MPADACSVAPTPPAPPALAPTSGAAASTSASEARAPERAAVEPPVSPAEAERLGNRIAELAARIQAATYELLVLIRELDAAGVWSGFASCAVWLSWRTGLAPGAAREHVRVAQALAHLLKLSDAMRRGRVSYSKVRAVPGGDAGDRAGAARRGAGGDDGARRAGGAGVAADGPARRSGSRTGSGRRTGPCTPGSATTGW